MKRSGIRETTPKIPNNHLSVVDQMEKGYFVSPIMGNRIFAPIYRNDKPKYLLSDHPESRSNPDSLKYPRIPLRFIQATRFKQCTPPEFSATFPPMVQAICEEGSGA
jgi:hypothetical protein